MILRMAPHLNDNQMQDLSDRTLIRDSVPDLSIVESLETKFLIIS